MHLTLDYAPTREIVYIACRRAAAFMGFGLNAARNDTLTDFTLSREYSLHWFPDDLSTETIAEYKREFEGWIVAGGLRELIEGFSVFLDRLYELTLIASCNGQQLGSDFHSRIAAVKNKGLPGKQLAFREEFAISSELAPFLKTLHEARNCLSHERGVVTPAYFNTESALEVRWRAFELFIKKEDGEETVLTLRQDAPPVGPFDQSANVLMRQLVRTRTFAAGELMRFSFQDLAEICIFIYLAADSFFMPAVEFAKQHGVE